MTSTDCEYIAHPGAHVNTSCSSLPPSPSPQFPAASLSLSLSPPPPFFSPSGAPRHQRGGRSAPQTTCCPASRPSAQQSQRQGRQVLVARMLCCSFGFWRRGSFQGIRFKGTLFVKLLIVHWLIAVLFVSHCCVCLHPSSHVDELLEYCSIMARYEGVPAQSGGRAPGL